MGTPFIAPLSSRTTITPFGNTIIRTFTDGAKVEVLGDAKAEYEVSFVDQDNGMTIYQHKMTPRHWCSPNQKYFVPWRIQVKENGVTVLDQPMSLKGEKVFVIFHSSALGDTLAWMPMAEEFRRVHQCQMYLSTFHNDLFKKEYPDIHFKDPGSINPNDYYAGYGIGCFDNDYSKNKNNWRIITLQQVASDILGLDYKERRPKLARSTKPRPIAEKYVCIAEFSTLQCKFWNRPGGWQEVVDYLNDNGLKVVSATKEVSSLKGVINLKDKSMSETIRTIQHAEFTISISCGIAWLSWALEVPTVLISGFSKPVSEMGDCIRVINEDVCHGCYNDGNLPFDRGNWNWCPRNKKFECSVQITPERVKHYLAPLIEETRKEKKTEAAPQYKVRLVHLLSRPDDPAEKDSVSSLSALQEFGIEYVQHINGYETKLPDLKPMYDTGQWGQPLKPGYYGVWKANKRAVEEEFGDDVDFLMICERDTLLTMSAADFYKKLMRNLPALVEAGVDYASFGYKESAYTGVLQSEETWTVNQEMYGTNKIIGLHCIVFPKKTRSFLLDSFKNVPWYAADIWYNEVFNRANKRMAIVRDKCVKQEDGGVSMIDGVRDPRADTAPTPTGKKVLFFAPHCSTGGMPQYMYASVQALVSADYWVEVAEYEDIAPLYSVQKDRIKGICSFHTLGPNKLESLKELLTTLAPDIVHLQEVPEAWLSEEVARYLYRSDRPYKIVETSHSSLFDPKQKTCKPDAFSFVSEFHARQYADLGIPFAIAEYTLDPKPRPNRASALYALGLDPARKHILHVGLFAKWKNQGEVFEMARKMPEYEFHFVGNQAPNFQDYWGPVLANKPSNCTVWGERNDTDAFYSSMDLFIFPSTMEMYPLVLKEALSWGMPVLMRDLPSYCNAYDNNPRVTFFGTDIDENVEKVRKLLPSMLTGILKSYALPKPVSITQPEEKLGIVIPSKYDAHLVRLLDNIAKRQPDWRETCRIVVGDDGISEEVRLRFSRLGVEFLPMQKPFNFARNINACVKHLNPQGLFLLLNDDIIFNSKNFVPLVREAMKKNLLRSKGSKGPLAATAFMVRGGGVGNRDQNEELYNGDPKSLLEPLGYICFVGVAISREAWDNIGDLDDSFGGYGCEDIDWSRRADALGYSLGVSPAISITHGFGEEAASCSFSKEYGQTNVRALWEQSKAKYVEKWGDYDWWGSR